MLRINKRNAYFLGLLLVIVIYMIGQLLFFINTKTTKGVICDVRRNSGRKYKADIFYLCFTTRKGENIQKRIGSNLVFTDDSLVVRYKSGHPRIARLNNFKSLWLVPFLYFLIPLGFIMAFITAAFYGHRYISVSMKPFKVWLSKSS